jgi:hypothetical protein
VPGFNSTGIAVDPVGQYIYYWQNEGRNLQQARYPDGAFLGTATLPFGYFPAVIVIDDDPVLNRVVLVRMRVFSPSQGLDIKRGFDFVIPGSGVIDFSVELGFLAIGDSSVVLGFDLTQDSYWLLGPRANQAYDQIIQIDRTTGQLVDRFILPDSGPLTQLYHGLALDPSTGLFYTNFFNEGVRALKLSPDITPPAITVSASPATLWPPNGKLITATVSGTITDNEPGGSGVNANSAAFVVMDEYGQVQPQGSVTLESNGGYTFTISLPALRNEDDEDGRHYTIAVSARDNLGNPGFKSAIVTVPHG